MNNKVTAIVVSAFVGLICTAIVTAIFVIIVLFSGLLTLNQMALAILSEFVGAFFASTLLYYFMIKKCTGIF